MPEIPDATLDRLVADLHAAGEALWAYARERHAAQHPYGDQFPLAYIGCGHEPCRTVREVILGGTDA